MNRFLSIIILSFFLTKGNAQGEWFSTAELDFIVPNRTEYNYSINNVGTLINLDSKVSLAVQYSINYQLFNKFSLGVLTGIQQQYGADIFMYKLGSNMKYYFVDSDNVYTYLQYASNFTVNKEKFKSAIASSKLESMCHRVKSKQGDSILVESGRIHAIDGGNLILEIQQNSDTTYRVYDWKRLGINNKPRKLHIEESLKSINFNERSFSAKKKL